jgi:hypothetical protein
MAHMLGCGLLVALDARSGFDRYYTADEALFYRDLDDLARELGRFLEDDALRRDTAARGWTRTWDIFDVDRVFAYMLAQLFQDEAAKSWAWPAERWSS